MNLTIPGTYGTILDTLRRFVAADEDYYTVLTGEQPAEWFLAETWDTSSLDDFVVSTRRRGPGPRSPQMLPIEALLTALLHALSALPVESILVFDDYHLIDEPTIHQAVSFLLDHLPSHVHVVISTRDDPPLPLPRLRMRGDLLELRAEDLRFTTKETALLLNEMMSLQLSEEDLRTLEARTEGWIAGLQLAALAMRDRDDPGTFISAFAGSNRYVTDYLMDEVLLRQPQATQLFLLQTSILDRMCASVCDTVMGWETGSQSVLTGLERANLFVVPLDEQRQWYRYHHLFAEVLSRQLHAGVPVRIRKLHSAASEWLEQLGSIADAIHRSPPRTRTTDRSRERGSAIDRGRSVQP